MRSQLSRAGLTILLGLTLVAGGLTPGVPGPFTEPLLEAAAADATVSTCDEDGFNAALGNVQSNGGGTITFGCTGTITFTGGKTITSNVTILGNGGVVFDGNDNTRLFQVQSSASLELIGLAIQNGNSSGPGGAIANLGTLTITASTVSGNNSSFQAGAIRNFGTLTITASTFSGNSTSNPTHTSDVGGAIINTGDLTVTASTFSGNTSTFSGAIDNTGGNLTVIASTFSGNSTSSDAGAIYNDGSGTLTITASTFSNNDSGLSGGAIVNFGTIGATITASTFSGNTADNYGGAILSSAPLSIIASTITGGSAGAGPSAIVSQGTTTIQSTIIAGNAGTDCDTGGSGVFSSQGSNLSDESSCDFTAVDDTQNSTTVNLGPLADNGGPTQTMLPQTGSDAIDAADCTLSSAQDQRGVIRPATACDIGAVETTGTVPVQIITANSPGGNEASPVPVNAVAYGPAGASLDYDFDCNNDTSYNTPGTGSGNTGSASCTFADDGAFTVGVQVCDAGDNTNCDTDSASVTVNNVAPTITNVANSGPVDEGSPATITVTATDPAGTNDPLQYEFDCDNDTIYETAGSGNQGSCTFFDNGSFTVGVQVSDDDGGFDTGTTPVSVTNVAPTVDVPLVNPSPSNEGVSVSVSASATFSDPGTLDTHTCTVDYGDGSGAQAGTIVGTTCTGPDHTYLDDDPSGTASDDYTVTVTVTDDDLGVGANGTVQTVNNLPPVINSITTNAPVPQGQPVTITVDASDPGVNDTHSYAFDCDNNGSYETAGIGNQGSCTLAPSAASSTIGVQVSDDDLGVTTGSVVVGQTLTLCGSYYTGELFRMPASGACPAGTRTLTLPASGPVTLCINPYSGALLWSPRGTCGTGYRMHVVPDSGPLSYCQSIYTGKLRYSWNGQCNTGERAGVIPGS